MLDGQEAGEVVGGYDLALDDGEVGFDLIEPAGVHGSVDENDVGPFGLEPIDGGLSAMGGAVVDGPEDATGGAIGLLVHDLGDETLKRGNAGLLLALAEQFGAMDIPGGDIGPSAAAGVLVLDVHWPAAGRWQRGMLALAGLDGGLLVGAQHVVARPQRRALPAPMVEVEDTPGLDRKVGVAREDPTAMAPRPQRVLAQPAPQRRPADLSNEPLRHHLTPQLGASPARQRQAAPRGQLTRQRLDLDHEAGGKSAAVARRVASRRGQRVALDRSAVATCSRSGAACPGGRR